MATENRRDRRLIEAWSGVTTSNVIPDGQFRWYDGVTGYHANEVIELIGDGITTIASLLKRQPVTDGAQTLYAVKTFDSIPVLPSTAPSLGNQAISKVHAEALIGGLPPGFLYGLETSAAPDSLHDVTIAPGKCRDYGDTTNLALLTALTKRIDVIWAAGNNAGGMFSGVVAANTTYHLFVIKKVSDGSIDAGWDINIDCVNIPAGYAAYRRIRSNVTDPVANIVETLQYGDDFRYKEPLQDDAWGANGSGTRINLYRSPLGITHLLRCVVGGVTSGAATSYVSFTSTDIIGALSLACQLGSGATSGGNATGTEIVLKIPGDQALNWHEAGNTATSVYLSIYGYEDSRGQHGGK